MYSHKTEHLVSHLALVLHKMSQSSFVHHEQVVITESHEAKSDIVVARKARMNGVQNVIMCSTTSKFTHCCDFNVVATLCRKLKGDGGDSNITLRLILSHPGHLKSQIIGKRLKSLNICDKSQ